jgi:hypothetical protein
MKIEQRDTHRRIGPFPVFVKIWETIMIKNFLDENPWITEIGTYIDEETSAACLE